MSNGIADSVAYSKGIPGMQTCADVVQRHHVRMGTRLYCLLGGLLATAALLVLTGTYFGAVAGSGAIVLAELLADRHAERIP
jgi:hypothetical protein